VLALIDTRDQPPPGGGGTREPWYIQVVASMFPWPAIITWLIVAGLVLEGWVAVGALWTGVMLATWRGLRLLPPDGGMRDYKQ
jgi:hypothetical protein